MRAFFLVFCLTAGSFSLAYLMTNGQLVGWFGTNWKRACKWLFIGLLTVLLIGGTIGGLSLLEHSL